MPFVGTSLLFFPVYPTVLYVHPLPSEAEREGHTRLRTRALA